MDSDFAFRGNAGSARNPAGVNNSIARKQAVKSFQAIANAGKYWADTQSADSAPDDAEVQRILALLAEAGAPMAAADIAIKTGWTSATTAQALARGHDTGSLSLIKDQGATMVAAR